MRKRKRGFTLVELLVVIAILAVLATVSILGYAAFTKKASISNDQVIIQQMNLILMANENGEDKARYPHEAVEQCIENGFIWENLTPSYSGSHFAYDQDYNRFMLLDEDMNFSFGNQEHSDIETNASRIFVVVGNDKEIANANTPGGQPFGLYLRNNFEYQNEIEVVTSIDTGIAENIANIKFKTDESKDVVIHTSSAKTTVTIDAINSEVVHYGKAGEIQIVKVKSESYTEKGEVAWLELATGRVCLTEEAEVTQLHIATVSVNTFADKAIVVLEEGATLPEFSRDDVEIASGGTKVCTVEKEEEKKDVYLFLNGIYEQIKVAEVSTGSSGEKEWIDESNASYDVTKVASDIANNYSGKKHYDTGYTEPTFENEENRTLSTANANNVTTGGLTVSAKSTAKQNQISSAIDKETGTKTVKNDEELAAAIEAAMSSTEEVVIQLGEGDYSGYYVIKQYPDWNGSIKTGNDSDNNLYRNLTDNTKRTRITIKGAPNGTSVFSGRICILGMGNSVDGDPKEGKDKVYTVIEGICFKNSIEMNEYGQNGKYPIVATGASSNVEIKNCIFINAGRILGGLAGQSGGYSYNFYMHDCTFDGSECVLQGYMHGHSGYTLESITASNLTSGFVNIQGMDPNATSINIKDCDVQITKSSEAYLLRMRQNSIVSVEYSSFSMSNGYIIDSKLDGSTQCDSATVNFVNTTVEGTGNSSTGNYVTINGLSNE